MKLWVEGKKTLPIRLARDGNMGTFKRPFLGIFFGKIELIYPACNIKTLFFPTNLHE